MRKAILVSPIKSKVVAEAARSQSTRSGITNRSSMNSESDKLTGGVGSEELSFKSEIDERLRAVKSSAERRTLAGVLRQITGLPLEQGRAALETSALIAAVSLRASIEFLRAAPDVARILEPAELRAWGELGRRLTMTDVETGV